MNTIKDNTNGGGGRGQMAKVVVADKGIMTDKTANVANVAAEDNNSLVDTIQEAIQLEDDEGEYASSTQAQEEDELLKEFGF